jgi:hypothetical protein
MKRSRFLFVLGGTSILAISGMLMVRAADGPAGDTQLTISHPECDYFGAQREKFTDAALAGARKFTLSMRTQQVRAMMAPPGGSRTYSFQQAHAAGTIDSFIEADFNAQGITPAPATTDWEFIRRVTLDLTGRIPTPDRVLSFVADTNPNKRAALIDELLAKPEWTDKWTMYFGDLYQNITTKASTSLNRFYQGRNVFYKWIHDSLSADKPYNQMATELITGTTDNTYNDGPSNWVLNSYITGGPNQDIFDQGTSFVFDTFLGITHVNCLLCHNGHGHLDTLSLWGSQTTRYQAWQLASYMSHTKLTRTPVDTSNPNIYYWAVQDNVAGFTTDYALNTTTGNRPSRVAPTGCKSGQPCYYVPPTYIFSGDTPGKGDNYRASLAKSVTSDFQFARATVNYIWAQFFGQGEVDPPDTFDPMRLDPNNPPPAPWTLQPTNAALLNTLAQHFIDSGYDLKALMREITVSDTYQLASEYPGTWNPAWQPYFARHYVRRLWGEELQDAVSQSSGTFPTYTITNFTDQGFAKPSYAMQFPDVSDLPGVDTNTMLDAFLRGNRDDQARKQDGSILQALNLMNTPYIVNRSHAAGTQASQLVMQNLTKSNTDVVNNVFLAILSRYPTSDEMSKALATFPSSGANRTTPIQNLVWSLYNKVDFVFNY